MSLVRGGAHKCLMDIECRFLVVGLFGIAAPDNSGPGGIVVETCDDVDMELGDDVADGSDVEFIGLKVVLDKFGNLSDGEHDGGVVGGFEFVEFFDLRINFGDEDEPWEGGVVFE